jgi:hypothetical protein
MTRERITEMLEQFAERGIGGVFVHPRPGLVNEYLSEEWFALWGFALEECRRLGLECHIYDENSFPSGFGGGHVISRNPLAAASMLLGRLAAPDEPRNRDGRPRLRRLLSVFRNPATGRVEPVPPKPHTPPQPVMHLEMESASPSLWQAGFTYVDLCRPEVTDQFLESTHAAYARRFGAHFGRTVRYVFADEPEVGYGGDGLCLSHFFLHEFRMDHGYDLLDQLVPLCFDEPGSCAVRHDYFSTLNRLFVDNYARRCHDWCHRHGLQFTGHFMEHQWPSPKGSPSTMAVQRWMQAPGIDLLAFQFKPTSLAQNALWLLNVKEAASIAAQTGSERVLCESCGGGGYDYGPAEMRPLEDFLLAGGVSLISPHLSHQTLAGARKYDWPQTLSDHSPWWDGYSLQARHTGRVNEALGQGREFNRVLILLPTTTGWLHFRPATFLWPGETPDETSLQLRALTEAFLSATYGSQIDFDLGDECVLAELGRAEQGKLRVGERAYDLLVLPPGLGNLLASTATLLEQYLKQGGTIISCGPPPGLLQGRPSPRLASLAEAHAGTWHIESDTAAAVAEIRRRVPPRLRAADGGPVPGGPVFRRVELPDRSVLWFIANPWAAPLTSTVRLEGAGLTVLDTRDGTTRTANFTRDGDGLTTELHLPPGHSVLWHCSPAPGTSAPLAPPPAWRPVPLAPFQAAPCAPNLLMLDYCDYHGPGVQRTGINTIHADNANWTAQGFDQNLWRVSIQFRRAFLDAGIPPRSGLTVRHHFQADETFTASPQAASLELALERPHLWTIRVNGATLDGSTAVRWFDEAMGLLPIGPHLRAGANTIELEARPFHVLCEIMPVYLRGHFHLEASNPGFRLHPPRELTCGDWTRQGRPFEPTGLAYTSTFVLDRAVDELRLGGGHWAGSLLRVWIDGIPCGQSLPGEGPLTLPRAFGPGRHELRLEVAGNLKNMLGPHFSDGLPGGWSWESCPSQPPPGTRYRFYPSGLMEAPVLEACGA